MLTILNKRGLFVGCTATELTVLTSVIASAPLLVAGAEDSMHAIESFRKILCSAGGTTAEESTQLGVYDRSL